MTGGDGPPPDIPRARRRRRAPGGLRLRRPGTPAPLPLGTGVAAQPLQGTGAVEKTDGRLGGATTARPAGGLEELSPGGRLDVSPRAAR